MTRRGWFATLVGAPLALVAGRKAKTAEAPIYDPRAKKLFTNEMLYTGSRRSGSITQEHGRLFAEKMVEYRQKYPRYDGLVGVAYFTSPFERYL
jgi:hypothetical protein